MRYLFILAIVLSSCKTSQRCEAYGEVEYDIHKEQLEAQKKYCSIEKIK
jgi:hypothetical protein